MQERHISLKAVRYIKRKKGLRDLQCKYNTVNLDEAEHAGERWVEYFTREGSVHHKLEPDLDYYRRISGRYIHRHAEAIDEIRDRIRML